MTKVIKLWKRFSFWNKVRTGLGLIGVGSEFAAYVTDAHPKMHAIVVGATLISVALTFLATDEDKDGVIDFFQKTRRKP